MSEKEQESFLQMHLDYDGGNILQETVRWSRFLSIVGFVFMGLFTVVMVIALVGSTLENVARATPFAGLGAAVVILCVLVVLAILTLLVVMLYRFSTLTRQGIVNQDPGKFREGMKSLKIYFLIGGIFALLGLAVDLYSLTTLF